MMRGVSYKSFFIITTSLLVLAFLVLATTAKTSVTLDPAAAMLYGFLFAFTMTYGVPLVGGMISLLPMVIMASFLTQGLVVTSWLVLVTACVQGIFRYFLAERLRLPYFSKGFSDLASRIAMNGVMLTSSILGGGGIYERLGGLAPLSGHDYPILIFLLIICYFSINYLLAILYFLKAESERFKPFLSKFPKLLIYEATPALLAPVLALFYLEFGWGYFLFPVCGLVAVTLIARSLYQVNFSLNRRVQELDSLQVMGETFSAALDIETTLKAVHTQVVRLMPVGTFYIAFYDEQTNVISFPLVIEGERRLEWETRKIANGLTEYVAQTRQPLLIRHDLREATNKLGLDIFGDIPSCWLGVPIILADKAIGVIAVQSNTLSNVYDSWHRDILVTIGSQAAVVIQNARLYEQTDSALAQRVQELDSILGATQDGILFISKGWHVLAANRAFMEITLLDNFPLIGKSLLESVNETETLITRIGYSEDDLRKACNILKEGSDHCKTPMILTGPPERHVEQTLVPVYSRETEIAGYLLILRDISEEVELAQTREDLTHMMVHDLRSPLSVILGSMATIRTWLEMGKTGDIGRLLNLAQTSGDRMLQLLNDLLDTYKFEKGEVPLNLEPLPILPSLSETQTHFSNLCSEAGINVSIEVPPGLSMVMADKDHVVRVLHNLVDNAIKFTPDGGKIRLWAREVKEDESPMVLIGVSDTGAGIPSEEQENLFLKFQHRLLTKGRRRGTGLGLPYCKLVVEAHGGRIWVDSDGVNGGGSDFMMTFPAYSLDAR